MPGKRPARTAKNAKTLTEESVPPGPDSPLGRHYPYVTLRPWPNLIFVLPMLVLFEFGVYYRHGALGGASQLIAPYLIERLVVMLGAGPFGFIFPGLTVIAILLACHLVARHPWNVDVMTLLTMVLESLAWTVPMMVFNHLLNQAVRVNAPALPPEYVDQVIRCLGAGLYEEFVFRLVLLAGLDILLINVLRFHRPASRVFAVLVSAALFAGQHHLPLGIEPFNLSDFMFRTGAGIYLALIFLYRGFGIAVGCHVFYNIIVVTAMLWADQ